MSGPRRGQSRDQERDRNAVSPELARQLFLIVVKLFAAIIKSKWYELGKAEDERVVAQIKGDVAALDANQVQKEVDEWRKRS